MSDAGRRWALVAVALLVLIGAAAVGIYAGLYNIAADVPHTQPVYWLLETVRDRSVEARVRDIVVPNDLKDPNRISRGAGQYADMCSGCHLAPGMKRTEISQGLYPRAPELRRKTTLTPAEQFWVVKHGIKMTGMPAWGVTHDEDLLWDVVAFVRKLPHAKIVHCRPLACLGRHCAMGCRSAMESLGVYLSPGLSVF